MVGHCPLQAYSHLQMVGHCPLQAYSHLQMVGHCPLQAYSHLQMVGHCPLQAYSHLQMDVGVFGTIGIRFSMRDHDMACGVKRTKCWRGFPRHSEELIQQWNINVILNQLVI